MANNRLPIEKVISILRLIYGSKMSQRRGAKLLSISRAVVADYVHRSALANITTWPLAETLDHSELENKLFPPTYSSQNSKTIPPNYAEIHIAMKGKGATLLQLHLEYLEINGGGLSYSQFCLCYREFKKTIKRSMRMTHIAGDKVFVDYSGMTVPIHNIETGKIRQAQIFVGVLGASNYIYADAVYDQSIGNWIDSHVRMFNHIGGVPNLLVCDNLKSAVIRASRTDPVTNKSYADMAEHYGCDIAPARAYKPKDKSKAEGGVLIVQRWILFRLRKRIFTDLAELNAAIAELLLDINARKFQKLPSSRVALLNEIDKPAMKHLNSQPYIYRKFEFTRVDEQYHIQVDGHFYSVPFTLAAKVVETISTAMTIEIMFNGKRVASHARNYEKGKATTDPAHMTPAHDYFGNWNAERDIEWAKGKGEHIHKLLQRLLDNSKHPNIGYRISNAVISLVNQHGEARMESVCKYALRINATSLKSIKSILSTGMDMTNKDREEARIEASFDHENVRGGACYS